MAEALAEAGCYCVQLGLETADSEARKELLGRSIDDEIIEAGVRRVREAGMRVLTFNIVGLPGESLEAAAETLLWNARLGVDFPRVSIFQPYPRTALGDRVLSQLRRGVPQDGAGAADLVGASYFRRSPLSGPEARKIENLQKLFYPFIRFPRLRTHIRRACSLPANPLFETIFLASMGAQYRKAVNLSAKETITLGLRNLKSYL